MNARTKTIIAVVALSLGAAAAPAAAQDIGRGIAYDRGYGDLADGYHEDGTLNVFGAHIEPRAGRGGALNGPIGGPVGIVGGVVGGVGSAVGGVVGGTVGAADDLVTGSIRGRGSDLSARGGNAEELDRPVAQYGRTSGGPARY